MGDRRHENDALAIRNRGGCEAANGPIKKLLILIELDDMVARPCAGQKVSYGITSTITTGSAASPKD